MAELIARLYPKHASSPRNIENRHISIEKWELNPSSFPLRCAQADSIISVKWFLFLFSHFRVEMDFYDGRILAVLKDGRPREFKQILTEVEFTHNTLRLHLTQLEKKRLVERRKSPQEGPGRPRFTYGLPKRVDGRAVSALIGSYTGLVVLTFEVLSRLCRHEKGGFCKEIRGRCTPQDCPKIIK